jgi:hypothetical protein
MLTAALGVIRDLAGDVAVLTREADCPGTHHAAEVGVELPDVLGARSHVRTLHPLPHHPTRPSIDFSGSL